MTKELKRITKIIDREFINYFKNDLDIETIIVVDSMDLCDCVDSQDNDYNIIVIAKNVDRDKIINFEKFLDELSKQLTTNNIEVGYSCIVGPVNSKVFNNKKNILIHSLIYKVDQLNNSLSQCSSRYRILYGKDYLKKFNDTRYTLDELVNGFEGINYCIDMLKKKEYRYLLWDTTDNNCVLSYQIDLISDDLVLENCFYLVNTVINNLINYCNFNNYIIPDNKMIFCIRLLGQKKVNEYTLFLLQGLFSKDESMINSIFKNPIEEVIKLLEDFKEAINNIDLIFEKEDIKQEKQLVISKVS